MGFRTFAATALVMLSMCTSGVSADDDAKRNPHSSDEAILGRASTSPVIVDASTLTLDLSPHVLYLEDSEHAYELEHVLGHELQRSFARFEAQTPSFGFTDSAYWFQTTLSHQEKHTVEWLLQVDYVLLDRIDLTIVRANGERQTFNTGDLFPFDQRPLTHRTFLFPFNLEPDEQVKVVARLQTTGSLELPLSLWRKNEFLKQDQDALLSQGLYFGVMIVMAVYNLFIFMVLRERSYLYYVCFVLSFVGCQAALHGVTYQYLWPEAPWWNARSVACFVASVGIFMSLFAMSFLGSKEHVPRIHKALTAIAWCAGISVLAAFVLPYSVVILFLMTLTLCVSVACFICGVIRWRQGLAIAGFYTLAWVSFLTGVFYFALSKMGFLERSFYTENGMQLGSVFEVLLLSFALAYRLKTLQDEKVSVERAASENLAQQVDERTRDLSIKTREALEASGQAIKEKAEAERAHARVAEMDRQKTQFFQNISHELRTPLTLVLNPLEDAALDSPEDDRLQLAERNARRLLRLVNQLLDFQKLSAGKKQLQTEHIDLVRFAWVCGDYIRSTCAGKDVTFRVMLDREALSEADLGKSSRFIKGEVDALEKIVFNYLSNAMKFTPPGGEIRLELDTQGEHLRLAVSDTGPGISADDQSKLFQLFSQVDGSATRETEGTGLGLALVKELTEALEGQVGVESQEGHGARFWASFPSIAPPAEDTTAAVLEDFEVKPWLLADHAAQNDTELDDADDEDVTGDGQRVLVVDDLADMRKLISEALKRNGYRTTTARDAFEGMDKAQASAPELIITDWMMPKKSGLDLIGEIRADEKLSHVPVVLLTARSDEEGKLLGTEVGADAFLGKPFNEQELCATVRNLLALKDHEKELAAAHQQLKEGVLKRYLPPALVDQIVDNNGQLGLEHEARTITVLFADLCGFTPLSRRLPAPALAKVLNAFLEQMAEVVFAHGGTIDKFIGDAVMVMFGAPEQMATPEQARRATACALDMQNALKGLNEDWKALGIDGLQIRIGLHTGDAVIGNFGSARRVDYTAIGDTVNTAARIESHGAPGQVLLSRATADLLPAEVLEDAGEFQLKGIEGKTRLYRVLPEAAGALKDGEVAA